MCVLEDPHVSVPCALTYFSCVCPFCSNVCLCLNVLFVYLCAHSAATFVEVQADFYTRVPVVVCREKQRCVNSLRKLCWKRLSPCALTCAHVISVLFFLYTWEVGRCSFLCALLCCDWPNRTHFGVLSALLCRVSAGNDSACLTTQFLSALANGEPRLLPLVLGLRRWATVSHRSSRPLTPNGPKR